jgi:FkbM family methyltransferase
MKIGLYKNLIRFKKKYIGQNMQSRIEDFFFLHLPVFLIEKLTIEYGGYFKRFRPKKGEIVIDCGAWKGHFSILASRVVGKQGKVFAIEPQYDMYIKLQERAKRLRLSNITVLNYAINSEDIDKRILKSKTSSGFTIDVDEVNQEIDEETEVIKLRKLDTILKSFGINQPNFIKMDIEGSEIEALEGSPNLLSQDNLYFAIASYHIVNGRKTCYQVEDILKSKEFNTVTEFQKHLTTYAWK